MFKLFTVGALVYILYRISTTPNLLAGKENRRNIRNKKRPVEDNEYTDYEEVD